MLMTNGEKMVWAAAFVGQAQAALASAGVRVGPGESVDAGEMLVGAVDAAGAAVEALRAAMAPAEEALGQDSDALAMLREMLGVHA